MLAMQYQITLPSDYDMGIIRQRVAAGGPLLDQYPGLGFKAFLVREKGRSGSPVNQYAPFYVWVHPAAAGSFLWGGGGFDRIVSDFGRPAVRTWVGGAFRPGLGFGSRPRSAVKTTARLSDDSDPALAAAEAEEAVRLLGAERSLHSVIFAIDPGHWELLTFAMYTDPPGQRAGEAYEVLHLSAPAMAGLLPTSGGASHLRTSRR